MGVGGTEWQIQKYLAASAVATGNGSALAGSWGLVMLLDVLRRWRRLLAVWIWRRRSAGPLIGAWQAVGLLVLVLRMLGHVGPGLLGRWRWERGAHLHWRQVSASCHPVEGEMTCARCTVVGERGSRVRVGQARERECVGVCVYVYGGGWG